MGTESSDDTSTSTPTIATASFANAFTVTEMLGADGAGLTTTTYGLQLHTGLSNGADSSLDTSGNQNIYLYLIGETIYGSTLASGTNAQIIATEAFTITVDSSGNVMLTQYMAIDHTTAGTTTNASTNLDLATLGNSLVELVATAVTSDSENDVYASSSATLDLGGNVKFADDGPNFGANTATEPTLSVDETVLATDTESFSGLFTPQYGADGAAVNPINPITYAMGVSTSSLDSGLVDTASGNRV